MYGCNFLQATITLFRSALTTNQINHIMLSNFFRINMPYGIAKNQNGEWMAFNREYLPLGFTDLKLKGSPGVDYGDLSVYTCYNNVNESILEKLTLLSEGCTVQKDANGNIDRIYFYNDKTNPTSKNGDSSSKWAKYFAILQSVGAWNAK